MARPTKAEQEEIRQRRIKAIGLRRAGVTWDVITEQCRYSSAAAACKDVSRAYEASRADLARSVDELRAEEDDRLQRLLLTFYPRALNGDLKAGEMVLKLSESRRKLYRLDKPEQVEVITMGSVEREIAKLREQMDLADPAAPVPGADRRP